MAMQDDYYAPGGSKGTDFMDNSPKTIEVGGDKQPKQKKKKNEKPFWEIMWEERPEYQSGLTAEGTIDPRYAFNVDAYNQQLQEKLAGTNLDTQVLDMLQQEAMRTGPSAWANLATQQQSLEEQNLRDAAARQALSGSAQARAALAMRGGLSGGAAERLARTGQSDLIRARQEVGRQGVGARAQIGLKDEEKRMQTAQLIPGMQAQRFNTEMQKLDAWNRGEQARMEAQQLNIQNALNALAAKNQAELSQWQSKGEMAAAERKAQAQENSSKK